MNAKKNNFSELYAKLKGQVIAHRGASKLAPENTAASFKSARDLGAKWVEFDVQCCGSQDWVVIHDETVDRTSNGHGKVAELPYSQLKTLDAGSWFHPKFSEERI